MYGAILGDMVGAPFEFDRGEKTKEFRLFTEKSDFTDDTVMTIAVADALLGVSAENTEEEIREAVVASMQAWGRKYPDAGYGARFFEWLWKDNPQPYRSWGNGSSGRQSSQPSRL